MPITLEPFVQFTSFNFCLKALDAYFHPAITAGTPDPYRRQNSAAAGSYRQPCPPGAQFSYPLGPLPILTLLTDYLLLN